MLKVIYQFRHASDFAVLVFFASVALRSPARHAWKGHAMSNSATGILFVLITLIGFCIAAIQLKTA
jgi:hypothetical protein